jgi:hypothetical protein
MADHSNEKRPHFLLSGTATTEKFSSPGSGGGKPKVPELDRAAHGRALLRQVSELRNLATRADATRQQAGIPKGLGLQIQFISQPDVELAFESLANQTHGIELLNLKHGESHSTATVFVPDGKLDVFERLIREYLAEKRDKNGRAIDHKALINTIQKIRAAAFEELWTDDDSVLPKSDDEPVWWEVWLPVSGDRETTNARFRATAEKIDFQVSGDQLEFPERTVLLMKGTKEQIKRSILLLNNIAEIRRAKETAEFFDSLTPVEQRQRVDDLVNRIRFSGEQAPHVCLLDTGVNNGHPLLAPALDSKDLHTVEPDWGPADEVGHGTELAGIALLGDLIAPIAATDKIVLRHRLESVKLLRVDGDNQGRHHGNLTTEAIGRPETVNADRPRVFSMAVTARDGRDRGRPSAWSAAIDALACDYLGEWLRPRLIILAGGNVRDNNAWSQYPNSNATDSIHDPGQAWNALTVGAYTDKATITDAGVDSLQPIAPSGGLSPFSTTSATWEKYWPLKPDVVMEGGNVGKDSLGAVTVPSLSLLTTNHKPIERLLTTTRATSAASALCARMAARLMAEYPKFWPETVRALIVHSAQWTPKMLEMFLDPKARSKDYKHLIRHCGFGVPDLNHALWSAANSLTLIAQDELQPFEKLKGKEPKSCDMRLHKLPWPVGALQQLGETSVEMRVTLSYFVEPNPGVAERGIKGRYRYESHGLRFEVKRPLETEGAFRARVNQRVREEEEGSHVAGGSDPGWWLGTHLRHLGSLHSDIWTGTAADLAERGIVAVYPAMGWWKTLKKLKRFDKKARYALVISIRAPDVNVDLYNIVENLVKVPVTIAT